MRICTLCLVLAVALLCQNLEANDNTPPEKVRDHLQNVVAPAIASKDSAAIVSSIQPLLSGSKASSFASTSKWFQEQGFEPLEKYLTEHRSNLAATRQLDFVKKPNVHELIVFLKTLDEMLIEFQRDVEAEPFAQDPMMIPENEKEYQKLLWDIKRLESMFNGQLMSSEYANNEFTRNRRTLEKKAAELPAGVGRSLTQEHRDKMHSDLEACLRDLQERSIELRFYRLEDAVGLLGNSPQLVDRLRAATVLVNDANELHRMLAEMDEHEFTRENLKFDNFTTTISELIEEGKTKAGDLFDKAVALDSGLEWWLKGRYGHGPLAHGLLKYPRNRFSQFAGDGAIQMPEETPQPVDPLKLDQETEPLYYPRRHYYTWSLESRPVQTYQTIRDSSTRELIDTQTTLFDQPVTVRSPCGGGSYTLYGTQTKTYQVAPQRTNTMRNYIPPAERDFVYRIVGTYEYSNAVEILSELVANSSDEEVQAYNTLVSERPEFGIFTNLATAFQNSQATFTNTTRNDKDRLKVGLDWVIALARIELASNVAAYTDKPGAFLLTGLQHYELEAFKTLLLDDLKSHLVAIQEFANRDRRQVKDTKWLDKDIPARHRRLKLIAAMLDAVGRLFGDEMNDQDRSEYDQLVKMAKASFQRLDAEYVLATSPSYSWTTPTGQTRQFQTESRLTKPPQ